MTEPRKFDYGICDQLSQAKAVFERLQADHRVVSVDIETGYSGEPKEKAQLHPEEGFIVGVSLTNSGRWSRYIPLRHDSGPNLSNGQIARWLWPLARDKLLIAWNDKFEARFLSRWFAEYLGSDPEFGAEVRAAHLGNPDFPGYFPWFSDAMLETHAEGQSLSLGLKERTGEDFGHSMMEIAELFARCGLGMGDADEDWGVKRLTERQKKAMRFNELDLLGPHRKLIVDYVCEDTLWALVHHRYRYPRVNDPLQDPRKPGPRFIYQLEMAVLPIVCAMEDEGLLYDWAYMRQGAQQAEEFLSKYTTEIQADLNRLRQARGLANETTVSLASPKQLATVLYEELGFRVPVYTKKTAKGGGGNPSTGKVAMQSLRNDHPVIQKIVNHKSLTRLKGTYLDKYEKEFAYCDCGRAHPDWMQAGVPAGRFAAGSPPVQQSPKKYYYELEPAASGDTSPDTFVYSFRDGITVPEGWYALGFDYAQQERRALAGEAGDPALLEAFNSGVDIHKATAAGLFSKTIEEITKDERDVGKTIGFAMDYGLGDDGMADRLGIPLEQAQQLREMYFTAYAKLRPYTEGIIATAHRQGYIITTFGRRVPIWGINDANRNTRSRAERTAGNAAIQGPATGDYPKIAMVRSHAALKRAGLLDRVRLVMNMHDALEWYVRKDVSPQTVIEVLQPAVVFKMPCIAHWPKIVAEWHIWERWGSVRELDVQLSETGQVVSVRAKAGQAPLPAQQSSGDEDEEFQVDQGAVQALATLSAAPAPEPAPAPDSGPVAAGVLGGAVLGSDLTEPLVITMSQLPGEEALERLLKFLTLRSREGGVPVILSIGGEDIELSSACVLSPSHAPEVALLLEDTSVTLAYRAPMIQRLRMTAIMLERVPGSSSYEAKRGQDRPLRQLRNPRGRVRQRVPGCHRDRGVRARGCAGPSVSEAQ